MAKFVNCILLSLCFFSMSIGIKNLSAETLQITSVVVEGNTRISDNAILNYSRLETGKDLSSEELKIAYSKVYDTGLFKNVEFKKNGSELIIFVEEYPTLNSITFEGNRGFTDDRLSSILKLKVRFALKPEVLEQDLNNLTAVYKNSGRITARINPKIIELSDNRVNLIFEIYEGNIAEIEKISFVGNRSFSDRRLRRVLDSKQAGFLRKIISRDTLIDERILLDRKLLTEFYQSRGFVDFRIINVSSQLSEEKDGFFISYNLTEGPRYTFGKVNLVSEVTGISSDSLRGLIDSKSGQIYSPMAIQDEVSRMGEYLQKKGINFVNISPKVQKNLNNLTIDIEFLISKGSPVFVERIDIIGNVATADRVIRRQFSLVEGDPFNPRQIRAATERIRALDLFSDVTVAITPGTTDSDVIVQVEVEEKPTGMLSFGAGYSSDTGLGGLIEYAEQNFLGRGQKLSFSIRTGTSDQLYELSFFEPMFLRNEFGLGFDLSFKDTNQQNASYDTNLTKFKPYIVYPLGETAKLKLEYSILQTHLSNPSGVGALITEEVNAGKLTNSSFGYELTNDSRLQRAGPKNGALLKIGQKFSGLGGDKTGVRTTLLAAAQREAFNEEVRFTAAFEAGLLTYSKGNSRVTDRFYLNSRKMRGFKPDGLGPRECSNRVCTSGNNDALGGENFAVLRLEAAFPLGLPEEYGLSGGFFYDIGNLWSLSQTNNDVLYKSGSWRQALGASIFWTTPIGPLRFNFTEVLEKEVYDKDETFDLTISTRF